MSVFHKNECTEENCRSSFETLADLITHIEMEHIDFDPDKIQQMEEDKPEFISLSYIQRFSQPDDPKPIPINQGDWFESFVDLNSNQVPIATTSSACQLPSEFKSDVKEKPPRATYPVKSNDLKFKEEFTFEMLSDMNNKLFTQDNNHKKPFACNMRGCQKRYKNINGIKYHYKNYHKFDDFTVSGSPTPSSSSTAQAPPPKRVKKNPAATATAVSSPMQAPVMPMSFAKDYHQGMLGYNPPGYEMYYGYSQPHHYPPAPHYYHQYHHPNYNYEEQLAANYRYGPYMHRNYMDYSPFPGTLPNVEYSTYPVANYGVEVNNNSYPSKDRLLSSFDDQH